MLYCFSLCPPLIKRVHQNMPAAGEVVFMDSTSTVDHDGSQVFILSTHSKCGGLPLGLIITSSERSKNISLGLQMLKSILNVDIFYKNENGPSTFITDDCEAEQIALNSVWPGSKTYLCIFHILQSVWRWLVSTKNGIPRQNAITFFNNFKTIVYSPTVVQCEIAYKNAVETAKSYPNYIDYLSTYWERRDKWALIFRSTFPLRGNNTNNYSEAAMRLLKEKIFKRVKTFNLVQLTDFLLTKFVNYYELRLLDAAHNRTVKKKL